MDIFKPNGKVITFWLWGEDEKQIAKLVISKGYVNIEWITEEIPPFNGL